MNTKTRISLVIPVYNEAERITDCLRAVQRQTVRPLEVIVVDNNSTDGTAMIARRFPFVKVLLEPRQGVVYARDTGFKAASGNIIARIDADTIISDDWLATVTDLFANSDVDMVSGAVSYRDIALPRLVGRLDLFWRRRMARLLAEDVAVQGANMALRRSVWREIDDEVCHKGGMHEDFDLAIHARRHGATVRFCDQLRASVCYRQADYNFWSFSHYALISPRTYLSHGVRRGRYMYQVVAFVMILYPLISLLSHGYDSHAGRFSISKLLVPGLPPRVNPATFVD